MSCLNATFTLTPTSPYASWSFLSHWYAALDCYGADFLATPGTTNFPTLYNTNCFYFDTSTAADPTTPNYMNWAYRKGVPFLQLSFDLTTFGAARQLALIFQFSAPTGGRVQIYNDAVLLHDQTLASGDSQLLLEIDTLTSPVYLYFVHAGGSWFFKGISGYLV